MLKTEHLTAVRLTLMNVGLDVVDCGDRLDWLTVEGNVAEAIDDHPVDQVHRLKRQPNIKPRFTD